MKEDQVLEAASPRNTVRSLIERVIAGKMIVGYGIVRAVNSDKTLTVEDLAYDAFGVGTTVDRISVLWPASQSVGVTWDVKIGDHVLLLGLRRQYDLKAKRAEEKSPLNSYTKLVALPIGLSVSNAVFKINVKASEVKIDSSAPVKVNAPSVDIAGRLKITR